MERKTLITTGTRHDSDWLDAMRYCYNDIITTMHYSAYCKKSTHGIEKVIFNDPATIVLWADGTKTIVKCSEDDIFDQEKGFAMAICKRFLGDDFKKVFKEFVTEEEKSFDLSRNEAIEKLKSSATNLSFKFKIDKKD